MRRFFGCFTFTLLWAALLGNSSAQVVTGTPKYDSFGGGPFDTLNLGNLNVHFSIPVFHKAGRGLPFNYDVTFDSSVWNSVGASGHQVWQPVFNWGWQSNYAANTGHIDYSQVFSSCTDSGGHVTGNTIFFQNWVYHDPWGVNHPFNGSWVLYNGSCTGSNVTSFTSNSSDGSGLTLNADMNTGVNLTRASDGFQLFPPVNNANSSTPVTLVDNNGNEITSSVTNGIATFTDTLNQPALVISGASPNPVTFSYIPPAGETNSSRVSVTINYKTYTVATNFAVSGISEYGKTSVSLVDNISLPDGTAYKFTYEHTPSVPSSGACSPLSGTFSSYCVTARLGQVQLPTGGTITYTYSGGASGSNGIFSDGSTGTLTRQLSPDGIATTTWNYARSQVSGSEWQTLITDPSTAANQTKILFQKDGSGTANFFETSRLNYQGSISGTLLQTTMTCYNGNSISTPSSCPTTGVSLPLTRRTKFTYLPDSSGLETENDVSYQANGLITTILDYGYGMGAVGPPLRKTMTNYVNVGFGDKRSDIVVTDGSGTTTFSSTVYEYDGPAVATTNVPQHLAVTGGRGNITGIVNSTGDNWMLGYGIENLGSSFTYFDTGSLQTSSLFGTGTNTYSYSPGTPSCNNGFATLISEPLGLSQSYQWDCAGGVVLSGTDENSGTTSSTYSDANFWRPAKSFDQLNNETDFTYPSANVKQTYLKQFANVQVGSVATLDGFGRSSVSQTPQGPGTGISYDSVQQTYDPLGGVAKVTLPYSSALSAQCSGTCPGTTTSYDVLGRVASVSDSGGGSVSYTYVKNDALEVIDPAPTNEHVKQKQYEYDALGRLTSVCEITTGTGTGACGQTVSANGFLTKYTYDPMNRLTSVTQNAQPGSSGQQTRTYAYDLLGRLISETNPETGTTTYSYDKMSADTSCGGTVESDGDLLKKLDAMQNVTCYAYDVYHRLTGITYPSGPYSSLTPSKHFVYDSATVNGHAMVNASGRLAEAYTCIGSCTSKITDLGLSYSKRGEVTDAYESTPNSGTTYYHLTNTYWPHGALASTTGIPSMPTLNYGATDGSKLDGEGRVQQITVPSGTGPLAGTSYNTASQVTSLTFGSQDNDTYQYDSNTGRLTNYTFSMGSSPQTIVGVPGWNKNGTLETLNITDHIVTANTENCTFLYDDLGRLGGSNPTTNLTVDCGSPWQQTLKFDPFGNLSKTGSASFLPTYNLATNQFSSIPGGSTTAYDADGNLLNDITHSYTWDADGNLITVDGSTVSLTYDALDRMVEQTRGSTHTQIVYSPLGDKAALMNGQSLIKAFVSLPSGAQAAYANNGNSAIISFYRHADHLGNSRLATTPGRAKLYDVAYAPYGEDYNGSGTQDLMFTGQNTDTVSGSWPTNLYDFDAREFRPAHGRWISPDPAGMGAADTSDPQSWNRYAYIARNPLSAIDPSGLDPHCDITDPTCSGSPCDASDPSCAGGTAPSPGSSFSFAYGFDVSLGPQPGETLGLPPGVSLPSSGLDQLIWSDLLGLPTLPCPHQSGPWCDPSTFNPWILDWENQVSCNTLLPDGKTVGDYVRDFRTRLLDVSHSYADATLRMKQMFRSYGPLDFKNSFKNKMSPKILGQAGNFVFYAVGSGILPTVELDTGAFAYALGTGRLYSKDALAVRSNALAANGCSDDE